MRQADLIPVLVTAAICCLFFYYTQMRLQEGDSKTIIERIKKRMDNVSIQRVTTHQPEHAMKSAKNRNMYCQEYEQAIKNAHSAVPQDDPNLIKIIRDDYVHKPSTEAYKLTNPYLDDPTERRQTKSILKLLKNMKGGFFVECGAYDGEHFSNTLYMERFLDWTGLLIEGGKKNFKELIKKNRKSWTIDACLSITPHPQMSDFEDYEMVGGVNMKSRRGHHQSVQCFPLFSILSAINRTDIDYFSLDIEGAELKVLKTIPWDKVRIKTISIEYHLLPEGSDKVRDFMKSKGYVLYATLQYWDYIYYHPKYLGISDSKAGFWGIF